ncbi:MAG: glycosyltransferase family 4 protein [Acidobacteriota bacterium]
METPEVTMRLAVFTGQFPSRVSTFFARDMRGLVEAGVSLEIFPLYPSDENLWRYVPDILNADALPRDRVHHRPLSAAWRARTRSAPGGASRFVAEAFSAGFASMPGGFTSVAKTAYALAKAWTWAGEFANRFDHILAYWGNYAATAALAFHRLTGSAIPVSMFLHAGTDLYRRPIQLRKKLLSVTNVITVCEFNRRYVEELYPDLRERLSAKFYIHHPGLDFSGIAFTPAKRPGDRLLAVGSLEKPKGFEVLLAALAILRRQRPEITLDLIGDGPQAGALRRLALREGIADRVHFRGWLTADEVQKAMGEATILVHPSSGLGDAVPTVIKEALAVGTPVVASSVAGIPELLADGRCGVLVPPRDPRRLAQTVAELLQSAPRRAELAQAGRAHAEATFDLWRNGQRLADRLLSTTRSAPSQAREGRPPLGRSASESSR